MVDWKGLVMRKWVYGGLMPALWVGLAPGTRAAVPTDVAGSAPLQTAGGGGG